MSDSSLSSPSIQRVSNSNTPTHGPVRLEIPKLGCIPVREFLILFSILGMIGSIWLLFVTIAMNAHTHLSLLQCVIGFTFHCLVLIGTVKYDSSVLLLCQAMTLISMGLCVFAFFIFLVVFNALIEFIILFSGATTFLEYLAIKRFRKHIEEREGTDGNQELA